MKANSIIKRALWFVVISWIVVLTCPLPAASAQAGPSAEDAELAQIYAPVLYFHPNELFRPQSVNVMVDVARLRQARRNWFDTNVLSRVSIADLFGFRSDRYALDVWYGDRGASNYKNYSVHRAYYEAVLSPEAAGPPIVSYAHVVRSENPGQITIQYWLFYYYKE